MTMNQPLGEALPPWSPCAQAGAGALTSATGDLAAPLMAWKAKIPKSRSLGTTNFKESTPGCNTGTASPSTSAGTVSASSSSRARLTVVAASKSPP